MSQLNVLLHITIQTLTIQYKQYIKYNIHIECTNFNQVLRTDESLNIF